MNNFLQMSVQIAAALTFVMCSISAIFLLASQHLRHHPNDSYSKVSHGLIWANVGVGITSLFSLYFLYFENPIAHIVLSYIPIAASFQNLFFTFLLLLLLAPSYVTRHRINIHALPLTIYLIIYSAAIFLGQENTEVTLWSLSADSFRPIILLFSLFVAGYLIHAIIYIKIFIKRRSLLIRRVKQEQYPIEKLDEIKTITIVFYTSFTMGLFMFSLCFYTSFLQLVLIAFFLGIFYLMISINYSIFYFALADDKNGLDRRIIFPGMRWNAKYTPSFLRNKQDKMFHRIEEVMKQKPYLDSKFDQSQLARILNTNVRYVAYAIKSGNGLTIKKYIDSLRIQEASILLSTSPVERSIEDIALSSGFSNIRTFYRLFTEIMHTTPATYRIEHNRIKN